MRVRHADPAAGAFSGAPYGATKRMRGVPNRARASHVDPAAEAFGGAPYGARGKKRAPLVHLSGPRWQ
eukprot:358881-Pyramimonas_sp.AAC.1